MRLPNAAQDSHPWRIRAIAPDFTVEDVWALPVEGDAEDFPQLVELMATIDPAHDGSLPTRVLWDVRDRLGRWFGLGRISSPTDSGGPAAPTALVIPGTAETTLTGRLPADLRNTATGVPFGAPFAPLYCTGDEFAAEMSNQTVHAVMHLAWVDDGHGRYRGQMAVYVKPRGPLGLAYMALIKPIRHWVVYPALMGQIERAWNARARSVQDPAPKVAR